MNSDEALHAETVTITGAGRDAIEAYLAQPVGHGRGGGVVVIHHMPGYDRGTKEITRRFATMGYAAVCPNLYSREAPGASPDDAAAAVRSAGGVPDERLVGDVEGAATHLRRLDGANGRVAVIGYCSGGRQALLAGCSLSLQAVVDCYGAFVLAPPPDGFPVRVAPLGDRLAHLSCPLLGLFGAGDSHPSPEEVAQLDRRLGELGKEHEFHVLADAGHGFFAVDRPSYSQTAAVRGWELIEQFFGRHLGEG